MNIASPSSIVPKVLNTEVDLSLFFSSLESEVNVDVTSLHAGILHLSYISTINLNGIIMLCIVSSIASPDVCKIAKTMLLLLATRWSLTAGKDDVVTYYQISAGLPQNMCRWSVDNTPMLSHLYLYKQMVIDTGAQALMKLMQVVLLETLRDIKLVFGEQIHIVQSTTSIKNCGRAIINVLMALSGQYLNALVSTFKSPLKLSCIQKLLS